jgi:hypothetical protein
MKKLAVFFFCVSLSLSLPLYSHGQTFQTGQSNVSLTTNPAFPIPNSVVEISLDDYSVDGLGATIQWFVNNVEQSASKNARSIILNTGPLGESFDVKVVLSRNGTRLFMDSIKIAPVQVDLILEADTYVPYFYHGKALPSGDSAIRAIAIVNDGKNTPASSYTYKWSEGATVLLGGPIVGKNVLDYILSRYDKKVLSVEVSDKQGILVGQKSILLSTNEPELLFYENSPLRGHVVTLYGEPFFINTKPQNTDFAWKINGEETVSQDELPNSITLTRTEGTGDIIAKLKVITHAPVPQFIERAFRLVLN